MAAEQGSKHVLVEMGDLTAPLLPAGQEEQEAGAPPPAPQILTHKVEIDSTDLKMLQVSELKQEIVVNEKTINVTLPTVLAYKMEDGKIAKDDQGRPCFDTERAVAVNPRLVSKKGKSEKAIQHFLNNEDEFLVEKFSLLQEWPYKSEHTEQFLQMILTEGNLQTSLGTIAPNKTKKRAYFIEPALALSLGTSVTALLINIINSMITTAAKLPQIEDKNNSEWFNAPDLGAFKESVYTIIGVGGVLTLLMVGKNKYQRDSHDNMIEQTFNRIFLLTIAELAKDAHLGKLRTHVNKLAAIDVLLADLEDKNDLKALKAQRREVMTEIRTYMTTNIRDVCKALFSMHIDPAAHLSVYERGALGSQRLLPETFSEVACLPFLLDSVIRHRASDRGRDQYGAVVATGTAALTAILISISDYIDQKGFAYTQPLAAIVNAAVVYHLAEGKGMPLEATVTAGHSLALGTPAQNHALLDDEDKHALIEMDDSETLSQAPSTDSKLPQAPLVESGGDKRKANFSARLQKTATAAAQANADAQEVESEEPEQGWCLSRLFQRFGWAGNTGGNSTGAVSAGFLS